MFRNHLGRLALAGVLLGACAPAADDLLDDSSSANSSLAGPRPVCGTRAMSDLEKSLDAERVTAFKAHGGGRLSGATTVTTYVHVLHNGAEGLLTDKNIKDQLRVLNQAYAPYGFQFALAPSVPGNPNPDFTDNAAWFNDDELAYKTALHEGTGEDLNIYTNNGAGYLGYAYYPSIVGTSSEILDGLVLAYGTLPGAFQPGISDIPGFVYNLGDTATHEIGHWFGLAHTFEGGCSNNNDLVDDTPAEKSADFYCTVGRNSCKDGSGPIQYDPIHNFMDYSDDVCLNEFTAGQGDRMAAQWQIYRLGH